MKKSIVLLLSVLLLVSLTACDTEVPKDDLPGTSHSVESETETDSQVTEEPITYNLTPGEVEGAIYSNESLAFAMSIPGGWTYYTEAEMLEYNKSSAESLEEMFSELKTGDSVFVHGASNKITGASILISVMCSDGSVEEKAIAEYMMNNGYTIENQFVESGYTDIQSAIELVKIGEEEHYAIRMSAMTEYSMTYNDTYFINQGDYFISITIGSNDENIRNELIQNFYWGENAKEDATANYKEVVATLGTMNGNVYTNTSLGIGCTLPSDWAFYDRIMLLTVNGLRPEISEEELAVALRAKTFFMDLYAFKLSGESLNIQVQRLNSSQLGYLNEQSCVKASISSVESLLTLMGYENLVITENRYEFMGKNHYGLELSASLLEVELYEKVVCVQIDQYMITVTVAGRSKEATDQILESFYSLEE